MIIKKHNRVRILTKLVLPFAIFIILSGCGSKQNLKTPQNTNSLQDVSKIKNDENSKNISDPKRLNFSIYGQDQKNQPLYKFSAEIPRDWQVKYVPEIEAINIYKNNSPENSQIFIRYFKADRFLTLNTVNILGREEANIHGHSAIKYEIEKRVGVPSFPYQPMWRNKKHSLIDIRLNENNPSFFYVFAHNPELAKDEFDKFISSLIFENDKESFVPPIENPALRITKKPFGIKIDKQTSPVQPERFSGYHTGVDFEILNDDEIKKDIQIKSICDGPVLLNKLASGYGGVLAQKCMLNNQTITIIYGHLNNETVSARLGDYISAGQIIGSLGTDKSSETDGERKHLHLGIFKGGNVDLRGYVKNESEISLWLDPCKLVCDQD